MKSFFLFSLISLLSSLTIIGQSLEENKRSYLNGKELYKSGNYSLAMEEFRKVASLRPNNPYYQYASYLYTTSAAKAGRLSEALLMAAQIENKYPTWNKINEVRYLASDIAFKQKNYKEAFNYLKKIDKGISEKEKRALVLTHLSKINSLDSLKQLNKSFSDNKYVGEALANRLMIHSSTPEEEEMLKKLVRDFKLDTTAFASSLKFESKKKQSYNVALLFPFMLKELNPENTSRPNFYAIDMYEGIKLGNEALAKKGVKLNLFTYDVGKENENLSSILSKPELKGMDFIIGPMVNNPVPAIDNFLGTSGVLAVNPVGTSPEILSRSSLLYLSEPDLEVQGRTAAEYIKQNYQPKSAAIFYGPTPKDSIIAFSYHKVLQDNGTEIRAFNKITRGNVALLTTVLSDSLNYDLGNIFLSSTEQAIAANFVSEIEKNGYKVPVVGSPQWLQYSFFNLDQFRRLNMIFIYPGFVNLSLPAVDEFRLYYKKSVNIIPSEFSYMGYDLIQFFGNALWKYGTNFQKSIAANGFTPGVTTVGYDFSKGNSNAVVPLVKFEEGDLKVINSPLK